MLFILKQEKQKHIDVDDSNETNDAGTKNDNDNDTIFPTKCIVPRKTT